MKSFGTAISVIAVLSLAFALPASADSVTGSYNTNVYGVSGTAVQGNFTFNMATDTFSGALTFSGAFSGVTEDFNQKATCFLNNCVFELTANVDGDSLTYGILLNLNSGQYAAGGTIWNSTSKGAFADTAYAAAPETGSTFLYLGLSVLVMFGAVFVARSNTLLGKSSSTH